MEWSRDRSGMAAQADGDDALSIQSEPVPGRGRRLQLAAGGMVFVLLTVFVFLYQFQSLERGGKTFNWGDLRFDYLGLLLVCLPLDTLASGLRIWLVCRVLEPGTGFWTCLKSEWANTGIALLTPMQTGGGIGQIYILHHGGADLARATTISLISFFGTTVSLLAIGFYTVLCSAVNWCPLFSAATWPLTIILALMSAALVRPGWFRAAVHFILKVYRGITGLAAREKVQPGDPSCSRRDRLAAAAAGLIGLVYGYHQGMRQFLRVGKACFIGVCLLSFAFILARCLMAFLCLRFLGIGGATLGEVIEIQLALLFLIYFAPTPGSSGLAEVFSLSAMAAIIPPGLGPYYNLLWRASTIYLPAALGLLLLALALLGDTHSVIRRRRPGDCR